MAVSTTARARFVALAEARTRRAIKDIRLISNLANRSNYSYEQADVDKIYRVLDAEIKSSRQKFETSKAGAKEVEFTLS